MLPDLIRTRQLLLFYLKWIFSVCVVFPLIVQAQPCTTTQFSKQYIFEGLGAGNFFDRIPGTDRFYFGGVKNYNFVMNTADNNGNLIWSKQYKFDPLTAYGGYDLAAIDSNGHYFINLDASGIGLLDANGDPITAKEMMPSANVYALGMGILPDNKKIILVNDQSSYGRGYMLVCLSADLSGIIWNQHFSGGEMYFGSLTIKDNKIFVPGSWQNKGTLLCFDAATGNLLSKKTFSVDNKSTSLEKVHPYNDGYVVQAKYYGGEPNHHLVFRLNQDLEVLNVYRFVNVSNSASIALAVEQGGDFYGAWSYGSFGQNRFYMSKKDSVLWNYSGVTAGLTGPRVLRNTNEGLILFSTGFWNAVGVGNFSAVALSRSDANGRFINCNTIQQPFQKVAMNFTTGVSTILARDTNKITLLQGSIAVMENNTDVSQNCFGTSICNSLKIKGSTIPCGINEGIFIAQRNTGCYTPVKWSVTGGKSTYDQLNDSTIAVHFLESGIYTIIGGLKTCQDLTDTVKINIILPGKPLDLGSDTTICKGSIIPLNAKKGYATYAWQDGSTDSIFQASQPGSYHVLVTDACGDIQRDTILITPQPAIKIDVGPDRIKCNNDTIQIAAPPGFLSYSWSPDFEISSTTAEKVIINPSKDTFYAVKVENTPGCYAFDTIHIKVNSSPLINLGPDIRLCIGDNVTFNAGTNFSSYQWSNGDKANYISVDTPGRYSVIASTNEGCSSHDTVDILDFYPTPVVGLDKDNNICAGGNKTLDAGFFNTYLWNNGSTARTLSVNNTGTYSVIVKDQNGCLGYDTTIINTILDGPIDFLPADTAICAYETIVVQSLNKYQHYLWNTNATSPAISISQPGIYWLKATDQNSCTGQDTIIMKQKDCMKGFYMPDAFTPNGDGKNDLLKPLLFGTVIKYGFTVFNRWGQIVFQTNNLSGAWDGNHAGSQDSNVFVWTCDYQLEGEKKQTATGTVVLIR